MTQFDSTHIFQLGWFNHRLDDELTGLSADCDGHSWATHDQRGAKKVEVESTSQLRFGICLDTLYLIPDPSFVEKHVKSKQRSSFWTQPSSTMIQELFKWMEAINTHFDSTRYPIQQTRLQNRAVFLFREKQLRMKPVLYSAAAWSVGTQVKIGGWQ